MFKRKSEPTFPTETIVTSDSARPKSTKVVRRIMWGKSKKNGATTSELPTTIVTNTAVASHAVTSGFSNARPRLNKKRAKYGVMVIVLAAIVLSGTIIWPKQQNDKATQPDDRSYVLTDKEYAEVHASTLQKEKPAQDASVEDKKAYYDELIANDFTAGDYKRAVADYDEAASALQKLNLGFNTYVTAAQSYAKLGDKSRAETVLNLAEQAVKKATYADEAQRKDLLDTVAYFREEIKK